MEDINEQTKNALIAQLISIRGEIHRSINHKPQVELAHKYLQGWDHASIVFLGDNTQRLIYLGADLDKIDQEIKQKLANQSK